jgi:hypothetical protein
MTRVTDAALLAQLNAGSAPDTKVSDEKLLAELNKTDRQRSADQYSAPSGSKAWDTITALPLSMKAGFDKVAYGVGRAFPDLPISQESRDKFNSNAVVRMLGAQIPSSADMKRQTKQGQDFVDENGFLGATGNLIGETAATWGPIGKTAAAVTQGTEALLRSAPALLQRVAPYVGAAAGGAVQGGVTNADDPTSGMVGGALAGMAGQGLGDLAIGGFRAGKNLLGPLYQAGRDRIVGGVLNNHTSDMATALHNINTNNIRYVPGVQPTLAETTMDAGLAQLQRSSGTSIPGVANRLAEVNAARARGYSDILDPLAGTPGLRASAVEARTNSSNALYDQAYAAGMAPRNSYIDDMAKDLMGRPSLRSIQPEAVNLARENGLNIRHPENTVLGLHYIKDALGARIDNAGGGATTLGRSYLNTKRDLNGYLEEVSPLYQAARQNHADMSQPINRMDVGGYFRDRAFSPLSDLNPDLIGLRPNSYALALRDMDGAARTATGFPGARMDNILSGTEQQGLRNIGLDMSRNEAARQLGSVPGSPTAQHLGVTRGLNDALNPWDSVARLPGIRQGLRWTGIGRNPAQPSQTEQMLAEALANPAYAGQLMQTRNTTPNWLNQLPNYLRGGATTLGVGLSQ